MRLISSCWVADPRTFEDSVALLSAGRALRFDEKCPLEVLVLSGLDLLDSRYISELNECNIRLIDAVAATNDATRRYRHMMDHINDYEFLCFVRWLAIDQVLAAEDYVHIDADLHIQIASSDFVSLFQGLNGTFGSPCLVAESGRQWFQRYIHFFNLMLHDRDRLLAMLGSTEVSLIRSDVVSDQDLINSLEKIDKMPSLTKTFDLNKWSVFVNPLWPYIHKPNRPVKFRKLEGKDAFDTKPILFWHLQNDFVTFMGRYFLLIDILSSLGEHEQIAQIKTLPIPYLQLDSSIANIILRALDGVYRVRRSNSSVPCHSRYDPLSRLSVTQRFIHSCRGREVFSERLWWEKNVFCPEEHQLT